MTESETTVVKGSFRGDAQFGTVCRLVHKPTGEVLFEGMGSGWSRRELWQAMKKENARKELAARGCVYETRLDRFGFTQTGWFKGEAFVADSMFTALAILKDGYATGEKFPA